MAKVNKATLERIRNWRRNNPDKVALYTKRWVEKNPEWKNNYQREYYKKNREELLRKRKIWVKEDRKKNPEKYHQQYLRRKERPERIRWRKEYNENLAPEIKSRNAERARIWYANNKEKVKERVKRYNQKNTEKTRVWAKNKRARRKESVGRFTLQEWEDFKKGFNYSCAICGEKEPNIKLTVDHIKPLSRGGENWISNIQPLCVSCNSKKHVKIPTKNDY